MSLRTLDCCEHRCAWCPGFGNQTTGFDIKIIVFTHNLCADAQCWMVRSILLQHLLTAAPKGESGGGSPGYITKCKQISCCMLKQIERSLCHSGLRVCEGRWFRIYNRFCARWSFDSAPDQVPGPIRVNNMRSSRNLTNSDSGVISWNPASKIM